jgi:hypothetical protein
MQAKMQINLPPVQASTMHIDVICCTTPTLYHVHKQQ